MKQIKLSFYQLGLCCLILFLCQQSLQAQITFTAKKKRPPQLDVTAYQKIAIGDIVGPSGSKTTNSMDLTDELTSILFNANAQEIIDRNAIESILVSQTTNLTTINEASVSALSKKLSSAIIIIGRIQNEKISKEKKNVKNIVVSNGCNYTYWWEISGDITAQIKVIDIKTGKMLFSNSVVQKILAETKRDCNDLPLGNTDDLLKTAIKDLAQQIARLIIPYDQSMIVRFDKPLLTLKNPFKKLPAAVASFQAGNNQAGLEILKLYAEDTSLKPEVSAMALYNYGAGLFIADQYDLAEIQLKKAIPLGSFSAPQMLATVQEEKKYQKTTLVKK